MDSNLLKTKSVEALQRDAEGGERSLRRTLTALDLTLLGIGAIIGTGIFVLTGTAAANQAGPAITLSYVAAGSGLRLCRPLLRGVRGHDPHRGQRLRLRLRDPGRDHRLDHRVGPDPRVRGRVHDRLRRLERLLPEHPGRLRHPPPPVDDRRPQRGAGGDHQPARGDHRPPHHRPPGQGGPGERPLQRRHRDHQAGGGAVLHRGGRAPREGRELASLRPLRMGGHHGRGGGGLLRLHRLRRGLHHGRGGQEPQARPAHRHHLLAGRLHGALHRGGGHPVRDRPRHPLPLEPRRPPRHPGQPPRRRHALRDRARGLRPQHHQPRLGRRPRVGGGGRAGSRASFS